MYLQEDKSQYLVEKGVFTLPTISNPSFPTGWGAIKVKHTYQQNPSAE